MEYHDINPEELPITQDHPCTRQSISAVTDLTFLSLNKYTLAPGEDLAVEYHYHEQREEAFFVNTGPLYVETPEETFTVQTGNVFVAGPKSPLRPYNPDTAEKTIEILGIGAPSYDIAHPYDPTEPLQ